ncbi:MAG: hypothetical protein ABW321_10530 [Polyangiales bacterium]
MFAELVSDGRFHLRFLGTTYPFAKVATGDFAAALLVGETATDPLHSAAGCALAEAAGAAVTDGLGAPWQLGNPTLIAAATPELQTYLVALLARHFSEETRASWTSSPSR